MSGGVDLEPLVVDLITRDAVRVPPYPAVAMRLSKLVSGGRYGIPDLVKIVGEDQVLAATLLRCANSAAYRGVDPVNTLLAAITRIGAAEVCRMAVSIGMGAPAYEPGVLAELRRKTWREAVLGALCCRHLALRRGVDAEEAFVCGLLHDFGRMVTIACFEEILTRTQDLRVLPEDEWLASVDRFHVELGMVTAARWNLTPLVCAVIASHHRLELAGQFRTMVEIVAAADAIVDLLHKSPRLSVIELGALPLRPGEADFLMMVVPQLPAFIAALDDAAPSTTGEHPTVRSQVQKVDSALPGRRPASFPVGMIRAGASVPFQATYIAASGLGMIGATKVKENNVVRLRLEAPAGPLEVWANVVLCVPEGSHHRVEAKLFAPDRPTQEAWDRLYASPG